MPDDDAIKIIMPLFAPDSIQLLQSLYRWAQVDASDIDDAKYTLLQKTAKLLSRLGGWIEKNPALLPDTSDLPGFFELLFEVAKNLSLKVSEPALRLWTHLLRMRVLKDSAIIQQSVGPLMEMCSQRLVRYEALPEDTNDPTVMFINEDFDTLPEKAIRSGSLLRKRTILSRTSKTAIPCSRLSFRISNPLSPCTSRTQLSNGGYCPRLL